MIQRSQGRKPPRVDFHRSFKYNEIVSGNMGMLPAPHVDWWSTNLLMMRAKFV